MGPSPDALHRARQRRTGGGRGWGRLRDLGAFRFYRRELPTSKNLGKIPLLLSPDQLGFIHNKLGLHPAINTNIISGTLLARPVKVAESTFFLKKLLGLVPHRKLMMGECNVKVGAVLTYQASLLG
jgi:hypothetical protein